MLAHSHKRIHAKYDVHAGIFSEALLYSHNMNHTVPVIISGKSLYIVQKQMDVY